MDTDLNSDIASLLARVVALLAIVTFCIVSARSSRNNLQQSADSSPAQRPPIAWLLCGGCLTLCGMLLMMPSFTDDLVESERMGLPATGAGLVVAAAGMAHYYLNWGLTVGTDQLWIRTATGRVKTLRYDQITDYDFYEQKGHKMLMITGTDGKTLYLSASHFDLGPLLDRLPPLDGGPTVH